MSHPTPGTQAEADRLLVVAAPDHALELLRLAILRSDDVVLLGETISPEVRRVARQFAIEVAPRAFEAEDLTGVSAVLVALDDAEDENRIVRSARRRAIPIHVRDRPLVSDFSMMALLEGHAPQLRAA